MIHLSRPFRGQNTGEKTWISSATRIKRRLHLRRVHTSGANKKAETVMVLKRSKNQAVEMAVALNSMIIRVIIIIGCEL